MALVGKVFKIKRLILPLLKKENNHTSIILQEKLNSSFKRTINWFYCKIIWCWVQYMLICIVEIPPLLVRIKLTEP